MSIRNILWSISDSIGQGYGDVTYNARPLGLLWRLKQDLNEFSAPDQPWSICNFGYSGATASQYYNRVKRIFLNTPVEQRPTVVLFHIYSPNGVFDNQGIPQHSRITGTDSAFALAQEAEAFFLSYNVRFIPWFICLSTYGNDLNSGSWVRDNVFYPAQTLWGAKFLHSIDIVQDPTVNLATQGIRMLESLTFDGTHPTAACYDLIQRGGSLGSSETFLLRFLRCAAAAGLGVTTLPALVRYNVIDGAQSYGNVLTNDGTLWFWPKDGSNNVQSGTFTAYIKNQEAEPITSAQLLISSIADPPAPIQALGFRDGTNTWSVVGGFTPPTGGTMNEPRIVLTDLVVLDTPVPSGQYLGVQLVAGAGTLPVGSNLSTSSYPSGLVFADGFSVGDVSGTNPSYSVPGIGVPASHVFCKYSGGNPRLIVGAIGDSTVGQYDSTPSTFDVEGFIYKANGIARAANKDIRYISYGQFAATWAMIKSRSYANLRHWNSHVGLVLIQVATYNTQFVSTAAVDAQWAEYLALKAQIELTGIRCRSLMTTPAGSTTPAENIAGYARMATLVAAEGGVNVIASISSNGVDINATDTDDFIHLNQTGSTAQAPAYHSAVYALAQSIGWSI